MIDCFLYIDVSSFTSDSSISHLFTISLFILLAYSIKSKSNGKAISFQSINAFDLIIFIGIFRNLQPQGLHH